MVRFTILSVKQLAQTSLLEPCYVDLHSQENLAQGGDMSWKDRLLAPFAGIGLGALITVTIWFAFFEYDPNLKSHGFFPKLWETILDNLEIVAVVASIGAAIGLLGGIFVAIFGSGD